MLGSNWLSGFKEEDSKQTMPFLTSSAPLFPLCTSDHTKHLADQRMNMPAKFSANWLSGFREVD